MHDKIICAKLLSILILWADDKMFGIKFLNSFINYINSRNFRVSFSGNLKNLRAVFLSLVESGSGVSTIMAFYAATRVTVFIHPRFRYFQLIRVQH